MTTETATRPQKTAKKRGCKCIPKSKTGFCPKCSKLKMVFLINHKYPEFKNMGPNGKMVNPVRYNYTDKNHHTTPYLIDGMLGRFDGDPLIRYASNFIHFYENGELVRIIDLRK